jgi:predicted alpha/beta superfamily hydrolase
VTLGSSIAVPSAVFGTDQRVTVYLPQGYDREAGRYPVVYATHSGASHLAGALEDLSESQIPSMLLVYLETYDSGDLLPTSIPGREGSGGADRLVRFFEEELIPFVDDRYRTRPFRIFHSGAWGGVFCIHALLSRPEVFQGCIAATPWVIYDGGARHMVTSAGTYLRAGTFRHNFLFVALGNDPDPGLREDMEALADTVGAVHPEALAFEYRYLPMEDHYSIGHKAFFDGLRWIFRDWTTVPDSVLRGGVQQLNAYRADVEARLGFPAGINWIAPYSRGFALLDAGDLGSAGAMFRICAELARGRPECQAGIGRVHEEAGEIEEARAAYQRSLDLAMERGIADLGRYRDALARLGG